MSNPVNWELIQPRHEDGATNMATDLMLLDSGPSHGSAVVRFYTWTTPGLSIGANTPVPGDVIERCDQAGVEVVRRPTGGGAVLHDEDVTYAVIAPAPTNNVLGTYRWVAEALISGFRGLGLDARTCEHANADRALACFAVPTGADLEVKGRKICGSAQLRRDGWFLQHGSIPSKDLRLKTSWLLGRDDPGHSTCLYEHIPGTTTEEVIQALTRGFTSTWGSPTHPEGLPNPLLLL